MQKCDQDFLLVTRKQIYSLESAFITYIIASNLHLILDWSIQCNCMGGNPKQKVPEVSHHNKLCVAKYMVI